MTSRTKDRQRPTTNSGSRLATSRPFGDQTTLKCKEWRARACASEPRRHDVAIAIAIATRPPPPPPPPPLPRTWGRALCHDGATWQASGESPRARGQASGGGDVTTSESGQARERRRRRRRRSARGGSRRGELALHDDRETRRRRTRAARQRRASRPTVYLHVWKTTATGRRPKAEFRPKVSQTTHHPHLHKKMIRRLSL